MKRFFKTFSRTMLVFCIVPLFIIVGISSGILYAIISNTQLVNINDLRMNLTSIIYSIDPETGEKEIYQTLYDGENRIWVNIDDIPENMKNAIIAIEDERFYEHKGFDIKRTLGATLNFFKKDRPTFGGSTITQQLIKNITGDNDPKPTRKMQEIYRAYDLEKKLNKEEILELYLNMIYLSQQCNGVGAASNVYFDKRVQDLSLAECASIAGITQYPSKYDPYFDKEANKKKQELVLSKMLELGKITEQEYNDAVKEELVFKRGVVSSSSNYPYFVDTVIADVLYDLQNELHYSKVMAEKMLYSGGLQITCTIDKSVQAVMDETYKDNSMFPKSTYNNAIIESAMVVLDPETGEIKGIVGGRGEKKGSRTLNRAAQSLRQPGSTIKPIAVYAPALEYSVVTPSSTMSDSPVTYTMSDGTSYSPRNYTNTFRGNVSVREALAQSLNVVAIKLLDKVGIETSFAFLSDNLKISSLVSRKTDDNGKVYSDKNLSSLALGGLTDGISVLEMTAAYVPFVNKGIYTSPHSYIEILNKDGEKILVKEKAVHVAMKESTAALMTDMLKGVVTFGTGSSAKLQGVEAAGKTGTTTNDVDRWFIGFTPNYVAAVWVGYDSPHALVGVSGNPAIPVWKKVMTVINQGKKTTFTKPKGMIDVTICKESGLLATDACKNDPKGSQAITDQYMAGTQPTRYCELKHLGLEESSAPSDSQVEDELPPGEPQDEAELVT